jgi:hypothetical protein
MISLTKNSIHNILVQLVAVAFMLPVLPSGNTLPSILFLCAMIIFVIIGSFAHNTSICPNKRIAEKKELFYGFLINIFSFILCAMIMRCLSIFIVDASMSNYFVYILFFFFVVKNISIRSPGLVVMKLSYASNNLNEKMKILARNICHISFVYAFMLKDKFQIDNKIINPVIELILFLFATNIISLFFVFKNMSLLDKLLGQAYKTLISVDKNKEV